LDGLLKAGPVRCATVDAEYAHLATAGDDKRLKVWALDSLRLLSERCAATFLSLSFHDTRTITTRREIPKKPSQIVVTRSGRTILVADKFGDVFRCAFSAAATTRLAL
jgi:tRNA (guanine-N(7)-)-methyltransferase subunit TRM82